MKNEQPYRFKTITEYHQFRNLPKPEHPLISVINLDKINMSVDDPKIIFCDFYCIALKRFYNGKMKYGQQMYDFDEGVMFFLSPGQVFSIAIEKDFRHSGWTLLVHPDFLWSSLLATTIKKYDFFNYAVNEALHLSEKEECTIVEIIKNINQEYKANIDSFSQPVILAQLELLLTYSDRFYNRQFITRKITNHKVVDRLEIILSDYFNASNLKENRIPTVQFIAEKLNVSPNYLSGLVKAVTGQSTQQHIHDKLIEKAKVKLSTTNLSISVIAYELGFEHSQSFSKLFKNKTDMSPLEFRASFN